MKHHTHTCEGGVRNIGFLEPQRPATVRSQIYVFAFISIFVGHDVDYGVRDAGSFQNGRYRQTTVASTCRQASSGLKRPIPRRLGFNHGSHSGGRFRRCARHQITAQAISVGPDLTVTARLDHFGVFVFPAVELRRLWSGLCFPVTQDLIYLVILVVVEVMASWSTLVNIGQQWSIHKQ
ncbi:hypothetical protein L1987_28526 [Smallanthus sonchifolius]|uniref:Uncharacterized protein n=1 Tax=Smallanthus sonchifolius TaxID=185202 RepID=A0ACB9HZ85_9ASTR|nr:hypothetical protein L1987_28526 [Smallanthus sonchifolius]